MVDPYRRPKRFMGFVQPETRVLEIGALHRPSLSKSAYNIKFADFTDTTTLKRLYESNPNYDISQIVDVDYIINGTNYIDSVEADRFDLVLASHVGEHMPDLIGWLRSIYEILDDGGILALILPDKRFTFDLIRAPTSAAELISNHRSKLTKPSLQQVYDHVVAHTPLQGINLWDPPTQTATLPRAHSENEAWEIAKNVFINDQYYDTHCSILTPSSFFQNLHRLREIGLMPFEIEGFYDTYPGDIDFQVRLRRPSKEKTVHAADSMSVFESKIPYQFVHDLARVHLSRRQDA